ncbi:MAG TPA: M14 family zinc carboxypeptidase [Gaiellaceae bacterium]|nr:M14 family zinc carboxypeptidase [Gaiellaceae bacterium]
MGNANAQLTPPWCGTPVPDAAENLPDGTDPTDPPGSFPHIPYYAIGCTLDQIAADQIGDRMSVEVIGYSALGRPLYGVVFNPLETPQQIRDYQRWNQYRGIALEDPARAQELLEKWGDDVKVPVFVNGAIHGNEYEGVESNMQLIEDLATTPYGADPQIDDILNHVILVFNVIQNPDGRVAGTRANGNGFDMNRDFMTQSQSEVRATVALIQKWLPVEVLDLHGYVTPTLIEATTKPHNPSIEYDLWLKWNQARIDANEAALNAVGFDVTRPINDWCSDGDFNRPPTVCSDGQMPGPAVAESWDDWGPFYTPMYAQHVGLDGSTVEMCNQPTSGNCGIIGDSVAETPGRLGSFQIQYITTTSTLDYVVDNRNEMLYDEAERYRRGVAGEPRVDCCDPPFDVDNNWMKEFPDAYVIPVGNGQRSDAEAKRLVDWLLRNGIEVETIRFGGSFDGQTFDRGSYVVWMDQAHRGLADTALNAGVDVSDRISILYAPPAAWSHGYLWGADIVEIPLDSGFSPVTNRINKTQTPDGGVEPGRAEAYALELDSATAVRTLNSLVGGGLPAEMALEAFPAKTGGTLPAGTVLFGADHATKVALASAGRDNGLLFRRVVTEDFPSSTDPIDRVPRIVALTGAVNQDVWSLRNLGFPVDTVSTGTINSSPTDPLVNYDVIWNTGGWPSAANPTARARLTAFFAAGGGYMGAGTNGANFLTAGAEVTGLTVGTNGGAGRSGIIRWLNEGSASPITGAYPAEDYAIVDPPSWFTAVPATYSVDARYPLTDFFIAGMWQNSETTSAPGSPFVVHGMNNAGTARLVNFAMSPLYRADPEREWPMVGAGAYWADQ